MPQLVHSAIEVAALGVIAFAASNIDDLFVLTAFLAHPLARTRHVVLGQYLGIALLTVASMACALAAIAIPATWLGLLGVLPVAIGVKKLWEGRQRIAEPSFQAARGTWLSVAAVIVANGADNIAIYIPLFAGHGRLEWLLLAGLFGVLTGLWCVVALFLLKHPRLGPPLNRYGHRVLPWFLIGLGAYILLRSGVVWIGRG